jgi:hypothetical protein
VQRQAQAKMELKGPWLPFTSLNKLFMAVKAGQALDGDCSLTRPHDCIHPRVYPQYGIRTIDKRRKISIGRSARSPAPWIFLAMTEWTKPLKANMVAHHAKAA